MDDSRDLESLGTQVCKENSSDQLLIVNRTAFGELGKKAFRHFKGKKEQV